MGAGSLTLSVVTSLWYDPHGRYNRHFRYTPAHVNRWAAMVRANLSLPHELVVVTDQPDADFHPDIRVVPLWDDARHLGGCWCRLKMFEPETAKLLGGRFVSMDLDCVILADMAPLFDRPEDIVLWRASTTVTPYNGSMWLMTAGCRPQVWETFDPIASPALVRDEKLVGTDQAWFSHVLGTEEAAWTAKDGVYHYRGTALRSGRPENVRVVFFPGRPKPHETTVRYSTPWVKEILDLALPIEEPVGREARELRRFPRRVRAMVRKAEARERLAKMAERRRQAALEHEQAQELTPRPETTPNP